MSESRVKAGLAMIIVGIRRGIRLPAIGGISVVVRREGGHIGDIVRLRIGFSGGDNAGGGRCRGITRRSVSHREWVIRHVIIRVGVAGVVDVGVIPLFGGGLRG